MDFIGGLMIFILFIYLPAQWSGGTGFFESIAPNNPFTFIVWCIFVGLPIIGILSEKAGEHEDRKRLERKGLLKPGASSKEVRQAAQDEKYREEKRIYDMKQRGMYLKNRNYSMLMKAVRLQRKGKITNEQIQVMMKLYRKQEAEYEEIQGFFRRRNEWLWESAPDHNIYGQPYPFDFLNQDE